MTALKAGDGAAAAAGMGAPLLLYHSTRIPIHHTIKAPVHATGRGLQLMGFYPPGCEWCGGHSRDIQTCGVCDLPTRRHRRGCRRGRGLQWPRTEALRRTVQ